MPCSGFARKTSLCALSVLFALTQGLPGRPREAQISRPTLLASLGESYQASGRFTKALDAFEEAWALTRAGSSENERAVANWSLGELLAIHSHLGHTARLEQLFAAARARDIHGPTTERLTAARESLWLKQRDPEMSYRCGPMALARIAARMGIGEDARSMLLNARATSAGMSLAQVESLARKAGMRMAAARRGPDADFVVPAVVHWKVDHYSALVERKTEGSREYFLVENPLFEKEMWVSRQTLDEETSGFFLVPEGPLPAGWRPVTPEEAGKVWGRCFAGTLDQSQTMEYADMVGAPCPRKGMAAYSFHTMLVSLHIVDEPLSYTPPVGPPVRFRVTYNQREAYQPAVFSFSNLGPKWTSDWISYVSDTNQGGGQVKVYLRGGGQETYVQQRSTSVPGKMYTYFFNTDYMSHAQLMSNNTAIVNGLVNYQRLLPDGSKEIFGQVQTTGTQRRAYLSQIVDPAGNAIKLTYDSRFRVVSVTDALGQATTLSYELASDSLKVTKVTDPFGRSTLLTYNGQGQLASITDPAGITSQFTYVNGDFISSLTTPYGTTTFRAGVAPGVDPSGSVNRSLEAVDPLNGTEHLEFRFYDPTKSAVYGSSLYWDKRAWAVAPNDPASARLVNWSLDSHLSIGLRHYEQPPLESQVHYSFADTKGKETHDGDTSGEANFIGLPVKIVKALDDGASQTYQMQYNLLGKPKQVIDPANRITLFDYDATGIDLLEIHNGSDNNATLGRFSYNSQHLPLTYTDAAGQTTTYTYNAQGQLLTLTDARKQTTTLTYDAQGYPLRITGPLAGATTSFTHDRFGRMQSVTDSEGYQRKYEYDALDRLTMVTYPDGTFEQVTYSNLDAVQFRDRLGRISQVAYDALSRPVTITDALGNTTTLTWCNCGDLAQITDASGNTISFERDIKGRITAKTYADGKRATYDYAPMSGRLRQATDPNGQITNYQYSADGSLVGLSFGGGQTPMHAIAFTYDLKYNRLSSVEDGIGTTKYTYGAAGSSGALQVTQVEGPVPGVSIRYTYDPTGWLLSRTIDGSAVSYTYDSMGRVTNETNRLGSFPVTYLRATGRPVSVGLPNGQQTQLSYFDKTGDNRVKQILQKGAGGAALAQFDYTYDAEGSVTALTPQVPGLDPSAGMLSYGYDGGGRLTSVTSGAGAFTFGYDAVGNRIAENASAATFNGNNQLVTLRQGGNPANYSYDANGNLVSDGQRTFEWDARDRLTAINNGSARSEFQYDAFDRRTRITEKQNGQVASDIWLVWCGSSLCEERVTADSGTTVTRRFFEQGETDNTTPVETLLYYSTDLLGSVRAMTDAAGNLIASYDYDSWGRIAQLAGDRLPQFGFTGHYFHAASGLYLAQYRAYDPNTGRWLSRDPSGESGGVNLYTYANNAPSNGLDDDGLRARKLYGGFGWDLHVFGGGSGGVSGGIAWGDSEKGLFPLQLFGSGQLGIGGGTSGGINLISGYADSPNGGLDDLTGESIGLVASGKFIGGVAVGESVPLVNGVPRPDLGEFFREISFGASEGGFVDFFRSATVATSFKLPPSPPTLVLRARIEKIEYLPARKRKRARRRQRRFKLRATENCVQPRVQLETSAVLIDQEVKGEILPPAPGPE